MAIISNYTTLKTAIADYLARSDLTSYVDNFIQNFEERFYRDSANWGPWMDTAYSGTIASSVIAVPSDFLAWKAVGVGTVKHKLTPVPLSQLYTRYPRNATSGYPVWIARNGSNFEFGPSPDSGYAVVGVYLGKQTVLRTDADGANWLTANAPDLLLYGALLESEPFLKNDERIGTWARFYEEALTAYRKFIKETNLSGGPLQTHPA